MIGSSARRENPTILRQMVPITAAPLPPRRAVQELKKVKHKSPEEDSPFKQRDSP